MNGKRKRDNCVFEEFDWWKEGVCVFMGERLGSFVRGEMLVFMGEKLGSL